MKCDKQLTLPDAKPSRGNETENSKMKEKDEPKSKLKLARASHTRPPYHDSGNDINTPKTDDVKSKIRLADGSEDLPVGNNLHLPQTTPLHLSSSQAVVGSCLDSSNTQIGSQERNEEEEHHIDPEDEETKQIYQASAVDDDALRNEILNEIAIHAEEVVEDKGVDDKPSQSYIHCAILVVIVLTLGLSLGLGLGLGLRASNEDFAIPSHIYGAEPTPAPSLNPTTTQSPTRSVLEWIEQVIGESTSTRDPSLLAIPDSPQSRALHWLLQEDLFFIETLPFATSQVSIISSTEWDQMLLERFCLATLYFATNGNGWNHNLGFLSANLSICDWNDGQQAIFFNGVSCTSLSPPFFVSTVALAGNNLKGRLPWNELLLLLSPVTLNLEGNQIEGGIQWNGTAIESSEWSSSLKTLNLARNPSLMGTLPSELGLMTNLKTISLWLTGLSGSLPPEMSNCSSLETVLLYANSLSGTLPPQWGGDESSFTSTLTSLSLWNNQLTGTIPASWGNLTALIILGLDVNRLSGTVPATFAQLSSLSDLYLEDNQLEGVLDPLFCTPRGENALSTWTILWSDCLGDSAEVRCSCCTACYDDTHCCYSTVGTNGDSNSTAPTKCIDFSNVNAISSYCL